MSIIPKKVGLILLSFVRDLLIYMLVFMILLTGGGLYGLNYYSNYRDKILSEYNLTTYTYSPSLKTEIYSEDGILLAEVYNENRTYIPSSDMPELLKEAMVSVEDRRFYSHNGIDAYGIVRALVKNVTSGSLKGQGASTITQQLTRELFLSQEKTVERKIKEIFIAMELEKKYDKSKILEIYLNEIYFGHGAYGIEAAAKTYFGKNTKDLNTSEIAILVGLPQAPSAYDPFANPEKTKKRRMAVLDCMYRDGLITKEEVTTINNSDIELVDSSTGKTTRYYKHPYFTSWVIQQLEKQYGDKIYTAGWKVYTTINSTQQTYAEQAVIKRSEEFSNSINADDMALVTIDPYTGALKAMVGGSNFNRNQVNMAVRPRQPGSSIKPIVYATGIDLDIITESSVFLDAPIDINGYAPKNYGRNYSGYMTVRDAIKKSNNIVAVKAAQRTGVKNIHNYAKEMGITTLTNQDYGLSMAIGGLYKGISPYEMATAFGVIANDGLYMTPHYISRITDRFGTSLYKSTAYSKRVLKQETADTMNDMLIYNVETGTGTVAQVSGFQCAGKTGTTDEMRDLWYVGYAEDAVTAIWVGNSNNEKLTSGTGSSTAGKVWKDYMVNYLKDKTPTNRYTRFEYAPYTILGEGDEVFLADSSCLTSSNTATIKTLYLRPENIPEEKKSCSGDRLSSDSIIDKVNRGEISVKTAAETGYVHALINAGYTNELLELGYDVTVNDIEMNAESITIPTDGTNINIDSEPIQENEAQSDISQSTEIPQIEIIPISPTTN